MRENSITYNAGFHVAANGVQLTKTEMTASAATTTMTAILATMGTRMRRRRSRRRHVKPPPAYLATVHDEKYSNSQ